ncbi:MAG: DUF1801 domain-containing protein [Pseudomonadota bacterium]
MTRTAPSLLKDPPRVAAQPAFADPAVEAVFRSYPDTLRARLLDLRSLVLATADSTDRIGPILECLKWQQPSYLPKRPRTGSTIRIDRLKAGSHDFAMFFHCQTTLVTEFRERYPATFAFEGNRALLFRMADPLPEDALRHCVARALTYHLKPV